MRKGPDNGAERGHSGLLGTKWQPPPSKSAGPRESAAGSQKGAVLSFWDACAGAGAVSARLRGQTLDKAPEDAV